MKISTTACLLVSLLGSTSKAFSPQPLSSSSSPLELFVATAPPPPATVLERTTAPSCLLELSFPKPQNGHHLPYGKTMEALRAYHAAHGNLVLPRKFIVPETSEYPSCWHGIDLAGTVYNMKWWQQHVKHQSSRVAELNELGFVWERLQPAWNLVLEALVSYSNKFGDLLVPTKFVVPYDDPSWPKATWGISLGLCVYRIRIRGDFMCDLNTCWSRREQLEALGFVWNLQEHRFLIFHEALQIFAQQQRNGKSLRSPGQRRGPASALRVPSQYVVPHSSPDWPEHLWGYKLGEKCTAVRQKGLYIKGNPYFQEMLEKIGFHPKGNAHLGWLQVVHAAAVYSQLNGRNLDVPAKFVVPAPPKAVDGSLIVGTDDAWPWPEYLWGFPLGQRLKDVRVKNAYLRGKNAPARRQQLDALGFVWKPALGRKKRSLLSK